MIQIIPATRIPAAESATSKPGTKMARAMDSSERTEENASDRWCHAFATKIWLFNASPTRRVTCPRGKRTGAGGRHHVGHSHAHKVDDDTRTWKSHSFDPIENAANPSAGHDGNFTAAVAAAATAAAAPFPTAAALVPTLARACWAVNTSRSFSYDHVPTDKPVASNVKERKSDPTDSNLP